MATERFGAIKLGGKDATVIGDEVQVGQTAPDFSAHANDWSLFRGLADSAGKVRIIAAVPSLDTEVCDRETRRFNQEAAALDADIIIEVLSMDMPYAQKRWCGAAGVDQVKTLSDHYAAEFGERYGCLIKERRILRRAVFVVGRDDKVAYAAYMPALGMEPNYEEVLAAARNALTE
ncbi:MAG: Thiol peroxidase [Anaerolineales bacterium]|nr:Thiol peroxidase [Anaerolineales bacterium]